MTSQFSSADEYGFVRPENFDSAAYEGFMTGYLRVLANRSRQWEGLLGKRKGSYARLEYNAKVKRYVRKGVPSSHRAGVWLQLSGASRLRQEEPDLFTTMLAMDLSKVTLDQIVTDVPRTFPNNYQFDRTNPANLQASLLNVLRAFATNNPKIGYCQGLNYIAGLLLLVTKDEDSAFWLLKVLCEKVLPEYYSANMPGLLTDVKVLAALAREESPRLARHIDTAQIPWALIASKWLICLYTDVLPTETVLRVWDCLFAEGSKVLFRVALALLKLHEERLLARRDFSELAEELKLICTSGQVLECHTFIEKTYSLTASLSRKKIGKMRSELGQQVRDEQLERDKRRSKDG